MTARWINRLAGFVAETPFTAIPADVREGGRLILADCIACSVAGNGVAEMRSLARTVSLPGPALVLGTSRRVPAVDAAALNGTAGTWHDLDEGNLHTKGHAGIQIVPAALAEAERLGRSGGELLAAVVLAYEASCRIYRACRARLAIHPHGTYGPIAAALAVGRLRGLDATALADIVNLAAALGVPASRGTLNDGATVRNVYTGMSGRQGFLVHDLAASGFTGEADAVSSVFGRILGEAFDPALVCEKLGRTWWIRRNYFKRFASARYIHSALDLVEVIAQRSGMPAPAAIERIDVETYFMAATMAQQRVATAFGTRFSIPFAVASLIRRGGHDLTADGTADFADPVVRRLARRVFVQEKPACTAAYPTRQETRVTIRLRDGRVESASASHIRGEAENPLGEAELAAKFVALASSAWGARNAQAAWVQLAQVEQLRSVRTLTARWQDYADKGRPR